MQAINDALVEYFGPSDCTPGVHGAVLYEHPNYNGRCVTFTGDDADFSNDNFNDIASSIRFVGSYASGWEAQLYEHTSYSGVSSTVRANDTDLGNDTIGNDRSSSIRLQRIDPDDNRVLSSGQTLNGMIDPANDQDTYYFDATQGQRATIRMNRTNTSLDSYLILYDPNGSEVTRDDDSGGNNNSFINQATLSQAGRYRIVASSYEGGSTGGYNLSLTLETPAPVCTPGANGVVLYEHPNHTGRCFTFTGDDADFNNDNFNDIASSIRFVGSYASGWEALLYDHTYYGGVSSTLRANDTDLGNDTIGHDRASSIRIRRVDTDDGRVLSSDQTVNGTIDPANDQDTYYFDVNQQPRWATIRMNRTNTTLDSYLILYGPDGGEVTRDDDSGGNNNSFINRATLLQTGRYRIVAKSYNDRSTGGYSLNLLLETPPTACTPSANGVVLYEHPNYTGRCTTFTGDDTDFGNDNFNDIASSIRFVGSYASSWEAVLYEHSNYGGAASTLRANDTDLGNDTIGHDRASSIRIRRVGSSNLALNRSANASSQESASYTPAKGNDGNTSTRWSSQVSATLGDQWWRVDLGNQTFDRVTIRWEGAYAASYFIGWSDNGTNYTGYWYTVNAAGNYNHSLGTRTARYVRILMRTRAPRMNNYSFWEAEVYRSSTSVSATGVEDREQLVENLPTSELEAIWLEEVDAEQLMNKIYMPLINQ